ncbi:serine/threonine-protein kinase PknD [Candidatus Mycobacterium methanotrophicum]|uniref:non-specific serine/threonine protein kinase n=1 Tax=Candidatus Mycobacterium methanotrophicum TaxID=2943498 RepID=A0ABY4QLW7_9MYCO|nr:serine/threonine-protein kinase PknD [Candidatus Mycobacterium methanotrophicum]UQX10645.1 serine/threonine-protein kinase PknD [Candidatus Mycobacterium methanotrophicum]
MSNSQPGWRTGSWFGPYRLVRLLGRGGMGDVYEAEDTRKGRVVALKLISPQFSDEPMFRVRMQREAAAAGRLTEPHVVPIHDYGEINGQLYLDMRLIEGANLAAMLKRNGPMSPPRAVAIVRQVASALDAAHAIGVTHRDVKPENILITGDDFAYLVDFGIARAATDQGITQTGMAMGTYKYMAPERFTGEEVTYRADIYALACVLSECLTGAPPFRADSIERMVAAHLMEPAPRPSQLLPGRVSAALDQVLAKGMAKKPQERYRSAGELANAALDALTAADQHKAESILQHGQEAETMARPVQGGDGAGGWRPSAPGPVARPPVTPPPKAQHPDFARSAPERPSRRKWWILAAIAVALLAAVCGYLVRPHSAGPATQACGQKVLPFGGLNFRLSPGGVAVDSSGAVYVTSQSMYGRVLKLMPGSTTPTVLPFTGLYQPQAVAVDSAGTVYVTDFNNRVVMLPDGSNNQTQLPFSGLNYPEGIALDSAGDVYVADRGNNRVVKLPVGSHTPTDLPFTGLKNPDGVAVDGAGNVYVADTDNNRVVKLEAGSTNQTALPFPGLTVPWGVAVDSAGNVYVSEHDNNEVLKLPAGSDVPTPLGLTGLNTPLQLAVDSAGNVYVADRGNNRAIEYVVAGCPG